MQPAQPEAVLGVIFDAKVHVDDYDLMFTDRRVVAAKIGISGGIGALIVDTLDPIGRQRYMGLSADQVLAGNRRNFAMTYASIESAELNGGIPTITIPSLTFRGAGFKKRFGLMSSFLKKDQAGLANAKRLLTMTLGTRVSFKRL